jgi:hypothetical protein
MAVPAGSVRSAIGTAISPTSVAPTAPAGIGTTTERAQ